MRYVFLGAMLATTAAGPALAQDEPAPFTGAHVEALAGYDNVGGGSEGREGFAYGIGAGYDFQVGGAVLGLEGEASDSTTRARAFDVAVPGDRARYNANRDLYIGARVGVAVAPKTLMYAKGGYTNAQFTTTYDNGTGTNVVSRNTLDGYRLGAGVEQKLNLFGPSGFVKAEYRYSHYRNLNAGPSNVDINLDRHQVMVGLGVRF